jgi:hypothetical protein
MRRLLYRGFRAAERASAWVERQFTPAGTVLFIALMTAAVFGIDTRRTLAFQAFALFLVLFLVAEAVRRRRGGSLVPHADRTAQHSGTGSGDAPKPTAAQAAPNRMRTRSGFTAPDRRP